MNEPEQQQGTFHMAPDAAAEDMYAMCGMGQPEQIADYAADGGGKVEKVMREFKHGELHSGSKEGPKVENRKQAVAIALSEARKKGENVKPAPKK
jgi:hypothetical protein